MIKTNLYGIPKSSEGGGSTTVILNKNGGSANPFEPHYLWGQYFDDTKDIDGDMTVDGVVNAREVNAEKLNASDRIDARNGKIDTFESTTAEIENISGDNLRYDFAHILRAFIGELESNGITTKNLTVTGTAHFFELIIDKIKAAGGAALFTPADGFKVDKVETSTNGYRLYFKATDGDRYIYNMWQVNDQAICKNFNQARPGISYNISNKYYWCLVTDVDSDTPVDINFGTEDEPDIVPCHYIEISTSDYDGTVDPEVGDEIVMLGYRGTDNNERQSAIYISAYTSLDTDLVAPFICQYRGINDYDLKSHKYTWFAAGAKNGYHANQMKGSFLLESGKTIEEFVNGKTRYTIHCNINTIRVKENNGSVSVSPQNISLYIMSNDNGNINTLSYIPAGSGLVVKVYDNRSNTALRTFTQGNSMSFNTPYGNNEEYLRITLSDSNGLIIDSLTLSYVTDGSDGQDGKDGGHYEFRYKNAQTKPTKPNDESDGLSNDWASTPTTPNFANGEYTWMTQCLVTGNNVYSTWTDPIRITGDNGKDGEDGTKIEFIYTINNTGVTPATPATTQIDDWHDTSNGVTWTDNPSGVSEDNMYEYVSTRTKENGTWSEYSTPVIWSKWGEKGMDGDGYEYVYLSTESSVVPTLDYPTIDNNNRKKTDDEYTPRTQISGIWYWWSDNPVGVDETKKYCWVCSRKKINGTWNDFSTPAIWARWSPSGADGGHYEFRYNNAKRQPTKPASGTNGTTGGWSSFPSTPDYANGEYTWMTQNFVSGDNLFGTWTDPIRITGDNGKDGEDGNMVEFIYRSSTTPDITSSDISYNEWNSKNRNDDDFVPRYWTDSPSGVDETSKYEYVATRTKTNNIWSDFSTPVIWSKWGEKGMDGDGYEYIYIISDNTPTITYTANNGKTSADDEFIPNNWSDEPLTLDVNHQIEWVATRKKTNGSWSEFTTPKVWAHWAQPGTNGSHYEFRYQKSKTKPTKPSEGTDGTTGGWSATMPEMTAQNFEEGYYIWMIQCLVGGGGSYGTWTDPTRITGANGKDGEDGTMIEFIYRRSKTATITSSDISYDTNNFKNPTDNDFIPKDWTDNPTGVDSEYLYEYVSTRTKEDGTWSNFSTPVIWSKWGEKGMDGDGYEYIYKLSITQPSTPETSQTDDYVPSGWSDDPLELSETNSIEWVSVRKKTSGTWGAFSTPAIWAHWAAKGSDGGHYEFRYKNSISKPSTPTANANTNNTWSATATTPDFANGEYTWMTQCFCPTSTTYTTWTEPVRITGANGKDGNDGTMIEFIYRRSKTSTITSNDISYNTYNFKNRNDDDFVPINWTDNPSGVDSEYLYEYVATRTKEEGTWSDFSTPVIWSKWGEKGMDGDGYEYIYKISATQPTTPSTAQTDDYVPSGWSDDPLELSETNSIEWVSVRKKSNGTWGNFSEPVIWAHWAAKGSDGGTWTFRYKNASTKPNTPTANQNTDSTWSSTATTPNYANGEYTWMTQCFCPTATTYTTWTEPVRITGAEGKDGEDGKDGKNGTMIEFIYRRSTDNNITSTDISYDRWNSKDSTDDDFVPRYWTDNPTGVDETNKYEYVAMRTKKNDTWSDFSVPAIWSKWGEKGMDGDGYEYIFILSNTSTTPAINYPTTDLNGRKKTEDEYLPRRAYNDWWFDEPQQTDSTNQYCWVSTRKKVNGVWGDFRTPLIWNYYVAIPDVSELHGKDGKDYEGYFLIDNGTYVTIEPNESGKRKTNIHINYKIGYQVGDTLTILGYDGTPKTRDFTIRFKLNTTSSWTSTTDNSDGTVTKESTIDYKSDHVYVSVELKKGSTLWDTATVYCIMPAKAIWEVTDSIYGTVQGHSQTIDTLTNGYSELSMQYDSISSTVSSTTSTIDELTGDITDIQTSISNINQTANNISLSVTKIGEDLMKSGIDIQAGKIKITSANTEIEGNMNLYGGSQGFSVWNEQKTKCAQLRTDMLGAINNYSFNGYIPFKKEITSSKSKPSGTTLTIQTDTISISSIPSGATVKVTGGFFNIWDYNSSKYQFIMLGSEKTITYYKITTQLTTSNVNNVVASSTGTRTATPDAITRSMFLGYHAPDLTYTASSTQTLYISFKVELEFQGEGTKQGYYLYSFGGTYEKQVEAMNYIAPDGAIFSNSNKEFMWAGYGALGSRTTSDWMFLIKNKRNGICITPIETLTFNSNVYGDDKSVTDISNWYGLGTVIPVLKITSSVNLANNTSGDGNYPMINRYGLVVGNSSSNITVTLPDPANHEGKRIYFRMIGRGNMYIRCDNKIYDDDTDGIRYNGNVNIGHNSCFVISDGTYWILFQCGDGI